MPKDTHSSTQESDFIKIDNLVSTAFSLQYKVHEGLEFPKNNLAQPDWTYSSQKIFLGWKCLKDEYRKFATCNMSRLEAHACFFRLLMKGIFDPYVLSANLSVSTKTLWSVLCLLLLCTVIPLIENCPKNQFLSENIS